MADLERMKQLACQRAAQEVRDGMALGLGTGSTVYYFLHELGRMVREGVRVTGVPTFVADRHGVVGAQPYEVLEQLVEKAGAPRRA